MSQANNLEELKTNFLQQLVNNTSSWEDELKPLATDYATTALNIYGLNSVEAQIKVEEIVTVIKQRDMVDEAISVMNWWYQKQLGTLDQSNPLVGRSLVLLGNLYDRHGDLKLSIELLEKSLKIFNSSGSAAEKSASHALLAYSYWNTGNPEDCDQHTEELLLILSENIAVIESPEDLTKADKLFWHIALREIAEVQKLRKELGSSVNLLKKLLPIVETMTLADTSQVLSQISSNLCFQKLNEEALDYAEKCGKILDEITDELEIKLSAARIVHHMTRIGLVFEKCGSPKKTFALLENCIIFLSENLGPLNPNIARLAADLAIKYQRSKNFPAAQKKIRLSSSLLEQLYNPSENETSFNAKHAREISDAFKFGGKYYSMVRNFSMAEEYFLNSLTINEKIFGSDHTRCAAVCFALANSYFYGKNYDSAEKYARRADEIDRNSLSNNEFDRKITEDLLKKILAAKLGGNFLPRKYDLRKRGK